MCVSVCLSATRRHAYVYKCSGLFVWVWFLFIPLSLVVSSSGEYGLRHKRKHQGAALCIITCALAVSISGILESNITLTRAHEQIRLEIVRAHVADKRCTNWVQSWCRMSRNTSRVPPGDYSGQNIGGGGLTEGLYAARKCYCYGRDA